MTEGKEICHDINIFIFIAVYHSFYKAVPSLEQKVIIAVLTVEHISVSVWLKSHL